MTTVQSIQVVRHPRPPKPIKPTGPTVSDTNANKIAFGYSSILKTMWKKGQLPTVKYGFYGDELKLNSLSVEHLKCRSQGGKSVLSNTVLSSKQKNNARGDKPLEEVLSIPAMMKYFDQFRGVKVGPFDGDKYIDMVLNTIYKLIDNQGILFK